MAWRSSDIHHLVFDEIDGSVTVSIFQREGKTRRLYYGRFKINDPARPGQYRHIHQSLKTEDFEEAKRRAQKEHQRLKLRLEEGLPARPLKVAAALDKFLDNYQTSLKAGVSGHSEAMFRGFKKSVDTYWRFYLGLKELSSVTVGDLQGYELWRRQWATSPDMRRRKRGNYKVELARRTLEWEINAFKQFLRWCAARSLYSGKAYEWRFRRGERRRRSALTLAQYQQLVRYIRTEAYLRKGKHGHDARLEWHRVLLRTYIIFMANTGLRVGEARYLKWKDLSQRRNSQKMQVGLVRVSSTHSKVRKNRNVVANHAALRAWADWGEYRENLGDICASETYVFCDQNGRPFLHLREGFDAVMREAGVDKDADGHKFTPYSLRHTYITLQLQYSKDLRIYSLAKNCGTSVQMIEQFYSDAIPEDFIDELTSNAVRPNSFDDVAQRSSRKPRLAQRPSRKLKLRGATDDGHFEKLIASERPGKSGREATYKAEELP